MANEVELKLAFPASALDSILSHPLLISAPHKGPTKTLDNTYFDTAALSLHEARIAIRTRRTGDTVLQTVKCAAESIGGLSSRPEWEQPFKGNFDFSAVDNKSVRKLLQGFAKELLPVFTTVFQRETRIVQPVPEVVILVMIDTGKIIAGKEETPICEVELELAQGAASDLQNFAITLAKDLPLIPFDLSKAQRGYQLFLKQTIQPLRFGRSPIQPEYTLLQGFQVIADQATNTWLHNLHGALLDTDPEFLHQFRVALRRLKALLKAFRPILPPEFSQRWGDTFSRLAEISGRTRDLDVLRETFLQPLLCSEAESAIEPLMRHSLQAWEHTRQTARAALQDLPHGVYLLTFSKELHGLDKLGHSDSIAKFARQRLKKLHAKALRRFQAVSGNPTPEMIHRLRIACKNLRYSCEYFAPLFDAESMADFRRKISALQDDLGFIHDLHVALINLESWANDNSEWQKARDAVETWHAPRKARAMEKIQSEAYTLFALTPPWQVKA